MKIIDGRNPHAIPTSLSEAQFEALEPVRVKTYLDYKSHTSIKVYLINGQYVPAAYRDDTLILCANYKTMRGVINWIDCIYGAVEEIC